MDSTLSLTLPRPVVLPAPPKELKQSFRGVRAAHKAWSRGLRGRTLPLLSAALPHVQDDTFMLLGGGMESLVRGLGGRDAALRLELLRGALRSLAPPFAVEARAASDSLALAPSPTHVRRALALKAAGLLQGVPCAGLACLSSHITSASSAASEAALGAFRAAAASVLSLPTGSATRQDLVAALATPPSATCTDATLLSLLNYLAAAPSASGAALPPEPPLPPPPPPTAAEAAEAAAAAPPPRPRRRPPPPPRHLPLHPHTPGHH